MPFMTHQTLSSRIYLHWRVSALVVASTLRVGRVEGDEDREGSPLTRPLSDHDEDLRERTVCTFGRYKIGITPIVFYKLERSRERQVPWGRNRLVVSNFQNLGGAFGRRER